MDNYQNNTLIKTLASLSTNDSSYWSFRGRATRYHCHALFQYPAMMVPQMQGDLIDCIIKTDSKINTVFDPFVGSGTTLGECMTRGLNFVGQDINPLATLACKVKSGPFFVSSLKEKIQTLTNVVNQDNFNLIDISFFGIDKWFSHDTQIKLCKIRRAIIKENQVWARRFFWLSLSNTVRASCNSRNSTYKLHVKAKNDTNEVCAIKYFFDDIKNNLASLNEMKSILEKKNYLTKPNNGYYSKDIAIHTIDSKRKVLSKKKFDLIISSPPYGDNQTTVPYGQFSYLQLQWIDINDIDPKIDQEIIRNQNAIDSSSLGGSLKGAQEKKDDLFACSPSFKRCYESIHSIKSENTKKLTTFIFDLNSSLVHAVSSLRKNAYMIWTLGNRRISNIEVPLDSIMRELLENLNCEFVHQLERTIQNKRMAPRNNIAKTMGIESVLIIKKKDSN